MICHFTLICSKPAYNVFLARSAGRAIMVRYTDDLGALSDRMNIIHAVWVDEAIWNCWRRRHLRYNPISNLRLGSGVMPWRRYV